MSLRERGAQTVRELAEIGNKLHPLKMKLQAGATLTEEEQTQFDELEVSYRELEQEVKQLMRPKVGARDPWLRGVDHLHGPEHRHEQ